jgi:glycosyltransferase involved in cell wall biosynthesis
MHEGPDGGSGRGSRQTFPEEEPVKVKPRVALLRGPLLNPFEMQSYQLLQKDFDLVTLSPHQTQFDLSEIRLPKESLWCPISGKIPFERERRKWQAARDALTGQTHSFCGMVDRLKGFDIYHIKDQPFCFSFEAALAKRKFGGRLVVSQLENIPFLNDHKFMERHVKKVVRQEADLFLAASEGAKRTLLLEGIPEAKIRRIFNSIDVQHFSPGKGDQTLKRNLGIAPNAFVVLYVGRLAKSKGIFTLLEGVPKLLREDSSFHFLLVGKDEEGVGEWVRKRGLASFVTLAGLIPYALMPNYYRLSDLFILPSLPTRGWIEQFGYVLAEAMACGVPAVGSDCGAIPEVIGNPERIFPSDSVEELVKTLVKARRTMTGRDRRQVREKACRQFSSQTLAKNLSQAYQGVLRGNKGASSKKAGMEVNG